MSNVCFWCGAEALMLCERCSTPVCKNCSEDVCSPNNDTILLCIRCHVVAYSDQCRADIATATSDEERESLFYELGENEEMLEGMDRDSYHNRHHRSFRDPSRAHRLVIPVTPTIVRVGNSTILIHGDDAPEVAALIRAAILQYQGVDDDV